MLHALPFLLLLSSASIVGSWQGTLDAGTAQLQLVLHIAQSADGLSTTVDSPDQGALGIATSSTQFADGRLRVELAQLAASFEGTLNEAGDVLDGRWSQGGREFPLRLSKVDEVKPRPRPQTPQAPFPYREESVRVDAGDHELAGTLTVPDGDGPFAAAILISGSGPQDRDESLMGHKPFWVLADHLARQGIATLRYDDRGIGESTGQFAGATTADFVDDAAAALRYLRERGPWSQLGLIGHSEGGLIAPGVAREVDELDFAVLLAGPAIPGRELLPRQIALLAAASGMSAQHVELATEINRTVFEIVASNDGDERMRDRVGREVAKRRAELDPETVALLGLDAETQEQSIASLADPWFRHFLRYDPCPDLRRMRVPVLALYGTLDLQVPPSDNAAPMRECIAESHPLSQVRVFDGLNHLFQRATTGAITEYAQIETTIEAEVLAAIHEWILALPGE